MSQPQSKQETFDFAWVKGHKVEQTVVWNWLKIAENLLKIDQTDKRPK